MMRLWSNYPCIHDLRDRFDRYWDESDRIYTDIKSPHPCVGFGESVVRMSVKVPTSPIAAGDSEGTMGGLVRMGKPGYLEPIVRRAIENAEWCSSDPVCRELGAKSGQGPDSCNLAACHSCALLPETSCEEFNRFLDRSIVVDGPGSQDLGFFKF